MGHNQQGIRKQLTHTEHDLLFDLLNLRLSCNTLLSFPHGEIGALCSFSRYRRLSRKEAATPSFYSQSDGLVPFIRGSLFDYTV